MTHIAVQEAFGGSPVDWLEHASGEGEGVTCCALRPTAPSSSYPVRVQCTAWRFPVAHLTLFALRPINQMKRIVIVTHSIPPLVFCPSGLRCFNAKLKAKTPTFRALFTESTMQQPE
jgi:hypothetical protein